MSTTKKIIATTVNNKIHKNDIDLVADTIRRAIFRQPDTRFIPGTMEREIAPDIVFRPVRSWHGGTYAGEGLTEVKGDRSGCLLYKDGMDMTSRPLSVTHRIYWNRKNPKITISAILSYPDGICSGNVYVWETLGTSSSGIATEHFMNEKEMEDKIIKVLSSIKS
jgi:hypothetical protein